MRWKRRFVAANSGKPMPLWEAEEGYTISENIWRGPKDGWMYEIMFKGEYVGEADGLEKAKSIAEAHKLLDEEF